MAWSRSQRAVVETDPGSLLAVRIGDLGWAFALLGPRRSLGPAEERERSDGDAEADAD